MKITVYFILGLFLSLSSALAAPEIDSALRRSNGLLRFLAEQRAFRDMALHSIISNRCGRCLDQSEKAPCKQAVAKMIEILDYDVILTDDKLRPRDSWIS